LALSDCASAPFTTPAPGSFDSPMALSRCAVVIARFAGDVFFEHALVPTTIAVNTTNTHTRPVM